MFIFKSATRMCNLSNLSHFRFSKDPYQILSVTNASTNDDIKQAYHKLSKLYHPDIAKTKESENQFKTITEAYQKITLERGKESPNEDQTRIKYKDYLKHKNEDVSDLLKRSDEERIYREVFGQSIEDDPLASRKPENSVKQQIFEEKIKKFKQEKIRWTQRLYDQNQDEFAKMFKQQQQNEAARIITDSYTGGAKVDNTKLQALIGVGFFSLFATYLILHREKSHTDLTLNTDQIQKRSEARVQVEEIKKEKVLNVFKEQNARMLKYSEPEPDCYDLLNLYTIYPDLKVYWVNFPLFYEKEENFVKDVKFEKFPTKNEKIGIRVTHALEAERLIIQINERVLQNIFVKVEDVLKQIEDTGNYKPPGIFMRYYGYLHFKIRNKPIIVENLTSAKEHISLFDLFFRFQSPVPFFHDQFTEFKLKNINKMSKPDVDNWISNAHINAKSLPQIYLQGNVKNVFVNRPDPNSEDEARYQFVWGSHHIQ